MSGTQSEYIQVLTFPFQCVHGMAGKKIEERTEGIDINKMSYAKKDH